MFLLPPSTWHEVFFLVSYPIQGGKRNFGKRRGHQRWFFFPRFVFIAQVQEKHSQSISKTNPTAISWWIIDPFSWNLLDEVTKLRCKLDQNGPVKSSSRPETKTGPFDRLNETATDATDTQTLDRNWYIPSRSTCLGILPKNNVQNPPGDDVPSKINHFGASTSLKKWRNWPAPILLFICDSKTQKKRHQPSTFWLDVLFRLIRSPVFRVAKNRRSHRNKSNENASSFKREQHDTSFLPSFLPSLLACLLACLLARLLTYLLTFSIILCHSMVHHHGLLKLNSPTQDLVMVWVGLSPPSCRWILNA